MYSSTTLQLCLGDVRLGGRNYSLFIYPQGLTVYCLRLPRNMVDFAVGMSPDRGHERLGPEGLTQYSVDVHASAGQSWPDFGRLWENSTESGPSSARSGRSSSDLGLTSANSGRVWPKCSDFGQVWLDIDGTWPSLPGIDRAWGGVDRLRREIDSHLIERGGSGRSWSRSSAP